MNFTYENQGTTTFLVYEVAENEAIDTMSLGMITNNRISGIAGTVVTQMNTKKYIKYNVSAKISVKQFFSGAVNKKRLLGVFAGITDAMLSAEDYMIDPNMLILDLNYIFADVSTCETVLICLPTFGDSASSTNLGAFFKQIMFTTQFDQTENCDHVAKIINYLNSTPVFSLTDFKGLINNLLNKNIPSTSAPQPRIQPSPQVVTQPKAPAVAVPQPTVPSPAVNQPSLAKQPPFNKPAVSVPNIPPKSAQLVPPKAQQQQTKQEDQKNISLFYLLQHYNSENAAAYKAQKEEKKRKKSGQTAPQVTPPASQPTPVAVGSFQPAPQPATVVPTAIPQGQPMSFGETTVLGGAAIGETTVLNGDQAVAARSLAPMLIRIQNKERIAINKPVFRIGKERSYVDYFIGDNTAVSRSHAHIISRDGQYFIMDTNSTNHTYVNGAMIQSNIEVKLNSRDKIVFGNEEFEFRLG